MSHVKRCILLFKFLLNYGLRLVAGIFLLFPVGFVHPLKKGAAEKSNGHRQVKLSESTPLPARIVTAVKGNTFSMTATIFRQRIIRENAILVFIQSKKIFLLLKRRSEEGWIQLSFSSSVWCGIT